MEFQESNNQVEYISDPEQGGFLIRFIIKLSGGSVRDPRTVNRILLVIAALALVGAFLLYFRNLRTSAPPKFNAEDSQKQLEEYRKIQPF